MKTLFRGNFIIQLLGTVSFLFQIKLYAMSNPFASGRYGGGGNQPVPQPGGDLTSQIVNTVKQDMESGEKSGQWIFSCYR